MVAVVGKSFLEFSQMKLRERSLTENKERREIVGDLRTRKM
jgi:hypothetical protein